MMRHKFNFGSLFFFQVGGMYEPISPTETVDGQVDDGGQDEAGGGADEDQRGDRNK